MIIPVESNLSEDFAEQLDLMDKNDDGTITSGEMENASQRDVNNLRDLANTQSEFGIIRAIAEARGEYMSKAGELRSYDPGGGGRFRMLMDELQAVQGYNAEAAKKIAASVANATKGKTW